MASEIIRFEGRVASGVGEGAFFSSLDWLHRQLQAGFGWVPVPGTFNVQIAEADVARFQQLQQFSAFAVVPPDPKFCPAKCFPVRIGAAAGLLVVPQVANYRRDVLEILAPVRLRDALQVADGDRVEVRIEVPEQSSLRG